MTRQPHTPPPAGQTLLLALLALVLLCAALEGGARHLIEPGSRPLGIGSDNEYIDAKVGAIERLIAERGALDCLFIGSSVVFYGLMPEIIEQTYHDHTGQRVTCYNLGIPAMTATGAQALAEAVVARFQPRVLIYGFTLRAVAQDVPQSAEVYDQIARTPWIRYQRGDWNAEGWLIAQSTALRLYLPNRYWMHSDYRQRFGHFKTASAAGGYAPYQGGGVVDPDNVATPDYFRSYQPDTAALEALAGLMALDSPSTQVLLLEIPLPAFLLDDFEGGQAAYLNAIEEIAAQAAAREVALWALTPQDLIPADEWVSDGMHVNADGAIRLSRWIGAALAEAAIAGSVDLPVGDRAAAPVIAAPFTPLTAPLAATTITAG